MVNWDLFMFVKMFSKVRKWVQYIFEKQSVFTVFQIKLFKLDVLFLDVRDSSPSLTLYCMYDTIIHDLDVL